MPKPSHISHDLNKISFRLCVVLFAVALSFSGYSQQLPRFSQYADNEFLFNPSVAGYDGRTIANLSARKQWMGFANFTPSSYIVSLQGRILKSSYKIRPGAGHNAIRKPSKGRVGLGGILYHDLNGAIERTGGQFSYAYHVFIRNSQLSFGLTGNVFQYRISRDRAQLKNPEIDPLDGLIGKSTLVPDAGIGINYMTVNYHVGFSVAHVFQSKLKLGNTADFKSSEETRILRHYVLVADYRMNATRKTDWEYEPSVLLMFNENLHLQAQVTMKAFYQRQYWFGLSGRTTGDIIAMAGLKFGKYYFGYAYDYGFSGISRYTFGSHEICISAKFGDTARRYRWLDRY